MCFPNVPSDLSLLAFGIPPAREAEAAGGMPKVPQGQGLGRLARWALYYFWCVSGSMPYTDYLDQTGIFIESVYDSIGRDDHLVQILLIELRDDSPHARMFLKHLNPSHNSVAKMFSPLRAIFRNIFYKAA